MLIIEKIIIIILMGQETAKSHIITRVYNNNRIYGIIPLGEKF
jgi:hypothetical protein